MLLHLAPAGTALFCTALLDLISQCLCPPEAAPQQSMLKFLTPASCLPQLRDVFCVKEFLRGW